jgi:predicted nucleic acid-binding Zn ribbon protein
LPGALVLLLRDLPLSDGKIGFAWRAAVGPAVERATHVKLDGGVLLIEAASLQWCREITRSAPVILQRLRTLLGDDVVQRLDVRQTPNVSGPGPGIHA